MLNRLRAAWHGETSGLTAAAVIVGIASLASRVVGLFRDRILASTFGAGSALDTYYAAFRIPDFLYNLIILGALSAGFIPVFSEYLAKRGEKEAWQLSERVLSLVGAAMAVCCVVLALAAPWIVPLTVPGFSPENTALTVHLTRIMLLSPFFLGLSAVMGGILQAQRRFFAFSLAPVFYNLCIILGTLLLAPRFGMTGVAIGVVVGAVLHFAVQASVAIRLGVRRVPFPSFRHEGVRRIIRLMLPRTAGLAVSQLNLVILLIFASTLATGSVAVFNLASNLQSFPVGIIGISFAVAAFPALSEAASRKDREAFLKALSGTARKIIFCILPATALFFLLRAQTVRLALGAGFFDWDDTIRTATVLGIFAFSLLGQSLVPLFARAFYALQNTRTPLVIGLCTEVVNLLLAWWLHRVWGITGLAVAFSVAAYVNAGLLIWQLRRTYGPIGGRAVARSIVVSFVASCAIIVAGYPVREFFGHWLFPLRSSWQVLVQAGAAGVVGVCAFVLVAYVLKSEELMDMIEVFHRRLFRTKVVVAGAEEAQGR